LCGRDAFCPQPKKDKKTSKCEKKEEEEKKKGVYRCGMRISCNSQNIYMIPP